MTWIIRTDQDIQQAINSLKDAKRELPRLNFFGDNNHERLDSMIDTIKNKRTEEYVYKHYPSCDKHGNECHKAHNKWRGAMSGVEYLRGEVEINGYLVD